MQFDVSYGFCELIFAMQIALCKKRRCRDEATEEPSDERVWLAMSKTGVDYKPVPSGAMLMAIFIFKSWTRL